MNHYAEINAAGICFAQLQTTGEIDAPHMIAVAPGENRRGQKWTGAAWEVTAPTVAELAALELQAIDAATGMSRTLREVLISIGTKTGADVAFLAAKEAAAVVARNKLK